MEIKGFLETSFIDWRGYICSVVFTPRCNFRCPFCHNHELVLNPHKFEVFSVEYILGYLTSFKEWVDGVCVTGGEPTLQPDLMDFLGLLRKHDIKIKLDTNGTNPDLLGSLITNNLVDYVAMDIKGPLNDLDYSRAAGVAVDLDAVRKSVDLIKYSDIEYEFRTTVVPSLHSREHIVKMAEELEGSSLWRLQDFNPANTLDKRLRNVRPYLPDEMELFVQTVKDKVHSIH